MSQTGKTEIKVLVIGTRHQYQRHQDTMPDREKVRAEFDKFLRAAIEEQKIDLVVEEAGDDTAVWKNLRQEDQLFGEHAKASGSDKTVDSPVPTIARTIADEYRLKHEDVDVDVRANENDVESIKKRDEAMTEKIVKVLRNAERVLVIVGEAHRVGVAQGLKDEGMSVKCSRFPRTS